MINADGTGARALAVPGSEPSWAPDGKRFVFTSLGDKGQYGLAIVKADGSSGRTLTNISRDGAPTSSPDGRRIAFTRFRFEASGGQDIYTIAPSGKGRGRLIGGCFCNDPDWSPDGRHITYDANDAESSAQVWVANSRGKSRRRLTSRIGAEPVWSPSGRYIAFGRGEDLYLMNRDGSNQRRIPYTRAKAPPPDRKARYEHVTWQPLKR